MTAATWLVLDNLKQGWPYRTGLDPDQADAAYRRAVEDEYVKDGKLTAVGEAAMASTPWKSIRDVRSKS